MSIIEGVVVGAETGGFYTTEIEQSLRFNDDDSAYLSWTPASAGNRKTWTFSTWVKRGNLTTRSSIFQVNSTSTGTGGFGVEWYNADEIMIWVDDGTYTIGMQTSAKFRDPSAWYHLVLRLDTTDATSSNRVKMYINGEETAYTFAYGSALPQNAETFVNSSRQHNIGIRQRATTTLDLPLDGYLAETHFTDGTAYDATAFGEFKNGVWIPKTPDVTYGTNGFYLPYRNDYTVEGFSATTYKGTGVDAYVGGVGFQPDLVWVKRRDSAVSNILFDSVRGAQQYLLSDSTGAESTATNGVDSFEPDGFTVTDAGSAINASGGSYVAWCWDAGSGSPVSNTDGSITSTVKANPSRGFSIVSYTGNQTSGTTVGHGLTQAPDVVITKNRTRAGYGWLVGHSGVGFSKGFALNNTDAQYNDSNLWYSDPTSSVFYLGGDTFGNYNGDPYIAYCFHSVSGYSKMGSYTGTGASGNTVTTGFKPAFVMIKETSNAGSWHMYDSTRSPNDPEAEYLLANESSVEEAYGAYGIAFTDTGFSVNNTGNGTNRSGGTYIYMAFADTREAAFWLDDSGNNNDWENNGLTESDISLDSPTNNFATLSSVDTYQSSLTYLYEGNLKATLGNSSNWRAVVATQKHSSGKWYYEIEATNASNGFVGIGHDNFLTNGSSAYYGSTAGSWGWVVSGGIYKGAAYIQAAASYSSGDVLGIAVDLDGSTVKWYKNGTLSATTSIDSNKEYSFGFSNVSAIESRINFGQDSSFAGNKTPQGYTDANGIGDFYYAPPTGYLALCTANLPEPAIGPNSASTSDEHFNTVLYTGDGTSSHAITGVGFQPDLTWIKIRSAVNNHVLYDAIRGVNQTLRSSTTDAESTNADAMSSFDSDGFTVGENGFTATNDSGFTYVAWNWKANGSGVSNTDGSITSTVSANVDAGFSIVSYTGNETTGDTVGHGLTSTPEMIIFKNRDNSAHSWFVDHVDLSGDGYFILLNSTSAEQYDSRTGRPFGTHTSSVLTLGADGEINQSGANIIAYCFHSVDGYSKFGSYTGNGSADGTFVYTGFRPAFVIAKSASGADNWRMYDNKRDGYNSSHGSLYPNLSAAEDASGPHIDMLSNGFKWRTDNNNNNGVTFIYMAFAENPFKYSNAR